MSAPLLKSAAELENLHAQWLSYPVTQQLRHLLIEHKDRIAKAIATESAGSTDESDRKLRQLAVQLKTVETITTLIYDTKSFVARTIPS